MAVANPPELGSNPSFYTTLRDQKARWPASSLRELRHCTRVEVSCLAGCLWMLSAESTPPKTSNVSSWLLRCYRGHHVDEAERPVPQHLRPSSPRLWEQTKNGVGERECPGRERCPKGNRVRYVHKNSLYIYPLPSSSRSGTIAAELASSPRSRAPTKYITCIGEKERTTRSCHVSTMQGDVRTPNNPVCPQ